MSTRATTRRPLLLTASTCGLILAVSVGGSAGAAPLMSPRGGAAAAVSTATVTADVADGLAFTREEERMARDLYAALATVHGSARPMDKITASEQQHYDAVGTLLTRYQVADPGAGRTAGSYADAGLQRLYDDWSARGTASLQAAYQVGIELEQRDIADLQRLIAEKPPADVATVYGNLLAGSRRHLAAYQRAAGESGAVATGQGRLGRGQSGRVGQVAKPRRAQGRSAS